MKKILAEFAVLSLKNYFADRAINITVTKLNNTQEAPEKDVLLIKKKNIHYVQTWVFSNSTKHCKCFGSFDVFMIIHAYGWGDTVNKVKICKTELQWFKPTKIRALV